MLLFGGQLVPQDIMTSSAVKINELYVKKNQIVSSDGKCLGGGGLTSAQSPPAGCEERGFCTSSAGHPQVCCPHTARSEWAVQTCC